MAGLAVVNARVVTSDPRRPEAEALLAADGRLAVVGSRARVEAEARRRGGVKVVDGRGGTVTPGFHDAHCHLVHWGLLKERVDLFGTRSLSEALERVRARVASDRRRGRAGWLLAERWDESVWKENRYPTRQDLDELSRQRPILLRRICGHIAAANTPALDLLPATARMVDRDSGILKEDVVLRFHKLFPPPAAQTLAALEAAQRDALRLGLTAVQDMVSAEYLQAWMRLRRAGKQRLRATLHPYHDMLPHLAASGLATGFGDDMLRLGGIKLFADGSIGAHTAALSFEYRDEPGNRGLLLWRDADLLALVREAEAAGWQLAMHAIGDRAVEQCLRVLATARGKPRLARPGKAAGKRGGRLGPLRHRIEHYELVSDEQMARTAALGVAASAQPNFVGTWSGKGGMYERRFGRQYLHNNRFARMRGLVSMGFGSDCMPLGPLVGIGAAATTPMREQRLAPEQAIEAYTAGSARLAFMEKRVGMLRPGLLADFVLLGGGLGNARRIERLPVRLTVVGGRVAHRG